MSITTQATSRTINACGVTGKVDNQRQPKTTKAGQRSHVRLCYSFKRSKDPARRNVLSVEVAAPTVKRGFVMSEFDRRAPARAGMVYGHGGGHPQGRPHGYGRVSNHHAHPLRVETRRVVPKSPVGAKTMTQANTALVRSRAPVIIQFQADTGNSEVIRLHAAAEKALAAALGLLRNPTGNSVDLERATANACRAATLLKRACAAQADGSAV